MIHKITLDMDKECRECGALGVTESNLCLRCAADKLLSAIAKGADTKQDTRRLAVTLTDSEVKAYGEELAKVIVDKGKLEAEKAVLSKKIKPLVERLEELAPVVDSGEEEREVECRWCYDWPNRERFLVRLDTMELVETDVIPEWERQQRLDLGVQRLEQASEEEGEEGISICQHVNCESFCAEEPGHCSIYEHPYECDKNGGEGLGAALAAAREGRKAEAEGEAVPV